MSAIPISSTQVGNLDPTPSLVQTLDIRDIDHGTAEDWRLSTAPTSTCLLKMSRKLIKKKESQAGKKMEK